MSPRNVALSMTVTVLGTSCAREPAGQAGGGISVTEALGSGSVAGFARAMDPRPFAFPDDHGPHPRFRTEWWYFTGNLGGTDGTAYGFQFTIFRHALGPKIPERSSSWSTRDVWFAHFAVGDGTRNRFLSFERFQRGALGLAGARAAPFAAWVGSWRAESVDDETFPLRIVAAEDQVAIDLVAEPRKPLVLQGDGGLSTKGAEPGSASYYYSGTRLAVAGSVTSDGLERAVSGSAWLDREWSTSALSPEQEGWDWFAIQLDDGRELMLYRLRRKDGTSDPFASGTLVDVDGTARRLVPGDVRYEPGRRWTSPASGVSYPVEWKIRVKPLDIDIAVTPMVDASELDVSVRYWEGAIRARGHQGAKSISGKGFLEMTGYGSRSGSASSVVLHAPPGG